MTMPMTAAQARERYATDPEYRERVKARSRKNSKLRYYADLDASRAAGRAKWKSYTPTAEQYAARLLRDRERYLQRRDDPEFQARRAAYRPKRSADPSPSDRERARRTQALRNERIRTAQTLTVATATRRYAAWTSAEDDEVLRSDLTVTELALRLGRTRAAVVSRRKNLRKQTNPEGEQP